jgi:hypothetical protein
MGKVIAIGKQAAGIGVRTAYGDRRALDKLTDGQLAACELIVFYGLSAGRVAVRIGIDESTVRRWIREPLFTAACLELTRSYAAGQLVPLALFRARQLLMEPGLKIRDVVALGRFVADLAGLTVTGAPAAGAFAPVPENHGRSLDDLSAAELAAASARAQAALAELIDSESDSAGPLD